MAQFAKDYPGGFNDGPTGGTPITSAVMNNIEQGTLDEDARNPSSAGSQAIAARYGQDVRAWTASTSYAAGQPVLSPSGDVVTRLTAGTSAATWAADAANWSGRRSYVVSPTLGNGTTDATSAIQAQLTAAGTAGGGLVRIAPGISGAYKVTSELVVSSNTVIDARGATITLTGSAGRLLRNSAMGGAALRTVTDGVTTAGSTTLTSATAAFTSADVGRSVSIAGAGGAGNTFNSTIASVTNATTVVLTFAATTAVTAASVSIFARDANITILGGIWTRDSTVSGAHLLNLNRVDSALISDVSCTTANGKYSILLVNCTRVAVSRPIFNSYSDGVHIQGPCSQVLIDGPTGITGDDFIAITARDYVDTETTGGDVQNVTIRNVNATQARGNLVHLLAGAGAQLRSILVDGVAGVSTQAGGVAITDDTTNPNTTGQNVDGITVRNVSGTIAAAQALVGFGGAGVGVVLVDGVNISQSNVAVNGVLVGGTTTAVGIVARNLTVNSAANHTVVKFNSGAAVTEMVVNGVAANLDPAGSNGRFLQLDASPTRLSVTDVTQIGGVNFVNANTTATVNAQLSNIIVKSGAANLYLIGAAAAHNVSVSNLLIEGPSNGFFVLTAGSLDAQVNNFRSISGALLFRSATQTVRLNGPTAKVDVSILTPQDGDIAFNTNAALLCGTGPAVYQATAAKWKGLYSGATN